MTLLCLGLSIGFVLGTFAGVGLCVWLNRATPNGDPIQSHLRNAEPRR